MNSVAHPAAVAALARRLGPLRYSQLGRRPAAPVPAGDVDAVAEWVVAAADRWWHESGRPDPFTLAVVSADDGTLARRVLGLGPECLSALRYVLVDPGWDGDRPGPPPGLAGRLALEEPAFLYPVGPAPSGPDADPDEPAPLARRVGPLVTWLADLPVPGDDPAAGRPGAGLVVAVGEAGCLPRDRFEWSDGLWYELRLADAGEGPAGAGEGPAGVGEGPAGAGGGPAGVGEGPAGAGGGPAGAGEGPAGAGGGPADAGLVEIRVPLPPGARPPVAAADPVPGRYVVAVGAVAWLRRLVGTAPFGRLVVIDRWGDSSGPELVERPVGDGPPVPLEQLRAVREPEAGPEPVSGGWGAVTWRIG